VTFRLQLSGQPVRELRYAATIGPCG